MAQRYTLVIYYKGHEKARVKGVLGIHSQPGLRRFCMMYLLEILGEPIESDNISWDLKKECTAEKIQGVCVVHPNGCPGF